MPVINPSYFTFVYMLLLIAFLFIKTPSKVNIIKLGIINKILFIIEFLIIFIILSVSFIFLTAPSVMFSLISFLSMLSMISLVIVMIQTMMQSKHIQVKFIYATHIGVLIVLLGLISFFIPEASHKSQKVPPYTIFSLGMVILIPYFHVMVIHRFFLTQPDQ